MPDGAGIGTHRGTRFGGGCQSLSIGRTES
jgi:hypothetical protein